MGGGRFSFPREYRFVGRATACTGTRLSTAWMRMSSGRNGGKVKAYEESRKLLPVSSRDSWVVTELI